MLEDVIEALRRADNAAALEGTRRVLEADPGNVDALYLRGLAEFGLGDAPAAGASISQALAIAPDRGDLHMAMAALALGSGNIEAARRSADAAVVSDPNSLAGYVSLAHIAIARADLVEAERLVKLAELIAADHPQTLLVRGNLAEARGDGELALRLLTRVAEHLPDDPMVMSSLGLVHLRAKRFAFAEQALRKALDAGPGSRHLRWALVAALRGQGRADEALQEVDALCAAMPDDPWTRVQHAALLLELGRVDDAVADYRRLLREAGLAPRLLEAVVKALREHGHPDAAVRLVDALLDESPATDLLWGVRMVLGGERGDDLGALLDRWLQANPDSVAALQREAVRRETAGEREAAEAVADRALAIDPGLAAMHRLKMRAELHRDPAAAIQRLERLLAEPASPEFRAMLLLWRGLAADRAGAPADAIAAWSAMIEVPAPALPPPAIATAPATSLDVARDAAATAPRPRLLWGLPGSQVRQLVAQLRATPELALVDDRFGPRPRPDGFNIDSGEGGRADGDAERWLRGLRDYGLEPAKAVDWLPHWDPEVDARLPGARLIVVVRDPRDLLLNWWVFGSPQRYLFSGPDAAARWLADALEPVCERLAGDAAGTLLLRLEPEAGDGPQTLADFLELPADRLAPRPGPNPGPGGHDGHFPTGHWRRYQDPLGEAFARLAPVAERLGY